MPLLTLFKFSGLNLFFFHLLGQATFRFKCLCFCTILNHFRRFFSCFLQKRDISSCTLPQNDFHWLENVYISSACYFMWSASYMDMYTTVTHCKCISKDYYRPLHSFTKTNQPRVLEWHWKNRKGFAAVWHNFKYSQRYFQRHPCMCLLYVCENSNELSANVYWKEFVDTSLFSALKRPHKIHDFHLYFAPTLPYMPLLTLFKFSGLNLFFFHLLGQATFRFKCLCFCTILNHFRRCFSCFLQTSDISSCTLQQNDVHWLEKV